MGEAHSDPLPVEEKLINLISDLITPRLVPSIEIISWRNKQLIAVEVFPSPNRPHFKAGLGEENGVFIRVGSSNRKADVQVIQELHRTKRYQSYDEEPIPEENSEALDFLVASELFADTRKLTKKDLLSLKLITRYQNHDVPTHGGMILFGKNRLDYFPDARIQCGRFTGTTKRDIQDSIEFTVYPIEAIKSALDFVKKHALRALDVTENARNRERWNVPLVAVREAIINAVVHADYSQTGSPIRLSFFDDRIEIDNPGLLYDGLTIDDITQGISKLRNRAIGRVFKEVGLIEQWGSGIQRMIETNAEMGLPAPEFKELAGQFRVTLFLQANQNLTLDKINQSIVDLLSQNNGQSVKTIAEAIGLSTRATRSRLSELNQKGIVTAVGTGPRDPKRKFYVPK